MPQPLSSFWRPGQGIGFGYGNVLVTHPKLAILPMQVIEIWVEYRYAVQHDAQSLFESGYRDRREDADGD
jgi:hypothetical protein